MRIENCPKKLNNCPEANCPSYPCWAFDQHMDMLDRDKSKKDEGWE
ncbi:hypothetical protein KY362_02630 [Candidatus Woesearchaeota archaeon]|nr:hypothetical protein [Candidatus Woesearchaeota archaeon]